MSGSRGAAGRAHVIRQAGGRAQLRVIRWFGPARKSNRRSSGYPELQRFKGLL
jgi:hypothetical protein